MAHSPLTREDVIDRLRQVFREEGYEGASLAKLSEASGLGRSSLYHHFPNGKEDMAAAVLAASSEHFKREVLDPLSASGPAKQRIVRAAKGLANFYDGGKKSCLVDLFGVGFAGELFRSRLQATVKRIEGAFTDLLVDEGLPVSEAKARATDALVAIQGSLVVARAVDDPAIFRRVLNELPDRLLKPSKK
jgi:TetR/AcrR family transcriptional repressor of lmrAB and yxaGH operons